MENKDLKMIDPPIDQMIEKVGNKFVLTCLIAKRAKQLNSEYLKGEPLDCDPKVISIAAKEVMSDKVKAD